MSNFKTFTVYLGSSGRCREIFKDTARQLGHMIGEKNKSLVYGGMDAGLMGIVANEALAAGAHVTGIIPKRLKDSERIHPDLSETILVPDLWQRKLKMFQRANAILTLPGGFGTIDEFLEALYWADLGSHNKPVILVNTDNYWDDLITYIKALPDLSQKHLIIANTLDKSFSKLEKWKAPSHVTKEKFPHFEDEILDGSSDPIIFETPSVKEGYKLATALGLKQLGKHNRPIGIINDGAFDTLLRWIATAQKETFITDHCTELYSVAKTHEELETLLPAQKEITIDLAREKWGPSETKTHIELTERE